SDEALKEKVIEFIFRDIDELRQKLDGKKINKLGKKFTVKTKDIELVKKEMAPFRKFLNRIANPNIAFILLMLGIYGIIYEFASPGIGFGAAVGSVCLILAFFSLQLLPVNTAGLLLLILGILLMVLDLITPGFGILTTGGVISFIIGSLMLFDFPEKFMRVSLGLIISSVLFTLAFFVFAIRAVIEIHKKKIMTGKEGLIGEKGTAKDKDTVFVHGEYWTAESIDGTELVKGEEIEVVDVDGKILKIKKILKKGGE
ncbi:MAG: NfeD family protein, partial [Endomicrobiia bacterium]